MGGGGGDGDERTRRRRTAWRTVDRGQHGRRELSTLRARAKASRRGNCETEVRNQREERDSVPKKAESREILNEVPIGLVVW